MNTRRGLLPRSSTTSLGWPIVFILIGVLALALPVATSFAVARILAWVLVFDGIFQLFYAFKSEGVGRILWKVLVAVLYVVGGLYLLANHLLKDGRAYSGVSDIFCGRRDNGPVHLSV
jgi:uncharacterized membrane protein HdeD (DUF308 family)